MFCRPLRLLPAPVLLATLWLAPGASAAGPEGLKAFSEEVEALSRRVSPSVVQVVATVSAGAYAPETSAVADFKERYAGLGSGVVLDPQGYILTNSHVLEGARRVQVIFHPEAVRAAGLASSLAEARVVGFSRDFDLALLKVEASGLPALDFRPDGLPRQGEVVFAFGSPQGFSDSVTLGVVSATSRLLEGEEALAYVQTDAPINPGSSGGPLVDVEGRVAGINTLLYSESGGNEGIGFAIPAYTARFVYGELKRNGTVRRRLGLGITVRPLTPLLAAGLSLPAQEGLLVEDVVSIGKGEEAGFRPGQILLSVEGRPVRRLSDYLRAVQDPAAPERMRVEVLDGPERRTFLAPLEDFPGTEELLAARTSPSSRTLPGLGVVARTVPPSEGGLRLEGGVEVLKRLFPAAAEGEELLPGDVIHAVGRTPVQDLDGLERLLKRKRPGAPLVLQVERQSNLFYLVAESE
jgi:serine protease Do